VENEIEMAYFTEPDLNDALSAVCFICDERVFNKKDYPEFWDFMMKESGSLDTSLRIKIMTTPVEEWPKEYGPQYINWKKNVIGGDKNLFLRELIRTMKLT